MTAVSSSPLDKQRICHEANAEMPRFTEKKDGKPPRFSQGAGQCGVARPNQGLRMLSLNGSPSIQKSTIINLDELRQPVVTESPTILGKIITNQWHQNGTINWSSLAIFDGAPLTGYLSLTS